MDLLMEFEEINAEFAEPMSDEEMNALIERQSQVQEKLDAESVAWLEQHLQPGHAGGLIPIGHKFRLRLPRQTQLSFSMPDPS